MQALAYEKAFICLPEKIELQVPSNDVVVDLLE